MNKNQIITNSWSNKESEVLMRNCWPDEPELCKQQSKDCLQCGGCSFFAPFNQDWGLCCHPKSRHHLETVSEHFTCGSYVSEGWGPHSFDEDKTYHCFCDELFSRPYAKTDEQKREQRRDWEEHYNELQSEGANLPRPFLKDD
jgi:hypothetical protein